MYGRNLRAITSCLLKKKICRSMYTMGFKFVQLFIIMWFSIIQQTFSNDLSSGVAGGEKKGHHCCLWPSVKFGSCGNSKLACFTSVEQQDLEDVRIPGVWFHLNICVWLFSSAAPCTCTCSFDVFGVVGWACQSPKKLEREWKLVWIICGVWSMWNSRKGCAT